MRALFGRAVSSIALLVALSVILFYVMTKMPGDPVELLVTSNPRVRAEDVARLKKLRGLDRPWPVQYWRWLVGSYDALRPPACGDERQVVLALPAVGFATARVPLDDVKADVALAGLFGARVEGRVLVVDVDAPGVRAAWFVGRDAAQQECVGRVVVYAAPAPRDDRPGPGPIELDEGDRQAAGSTEGRTGLPVPTEAELAATAQAAAVAARALVVDVVAPVDVDGAPIDIAPLVRVAGASPAAPVTATPFTLTVEGPGARDGTRFVPDRDVAGRRHARVRMTAADGRAVDAALVVDGAPLPDRATFHPGFIYALIGDTSALGWSSTYHRPVWDLLSGRVSATLWLMGPAFLLAVLFALPLGVLAAARPRSFAARVVHAVAAASTATPTFWSGLLLIWLFAVQLRVLPAGGFENPGGAGAWLDVVIDRARHAALPVAVLAFAYGGRFLQVVRGAVLEELPRDFVRTARAKGLSERVVLVRHALRAALVPVVTVLALALPSLFGGALLTETVFAWPGMGRLVYDAVVSHDSYVAMVAFLVLAALTLAGSLVADALYLVVDPRTRGRR